MNTPVKTEETWFGFFTDGQLVALFKREHDAKIWQESEAEPNRSSIVRRRIVWEKCLCPAIQVKTEVISSATAGVSKPATPDAVASGTTSAKDKGSEP
jgi:hypothetical protein